MENFGSEIGQKMRSAVKAKLLELGTGNTTGYIDDELPDYVMIMVANKRSKQQMIADLNLFLGSQTELFVTWLHEVLQKLQEVTLPTVTAAAKKRKSNQKEESIVKKDKKSSKKEKKTLKQIAVESETAAPSEEDEKQKYGAAGTSNGSNVSVPVINSITDVFAEDLLEKAKTSMAETTLTAAQIKKGKEKKTNNDDPEPMEPEKAEENKFDIPTISEISSTTGSAVGGTVEAETAKNREKDLEELAEIKKKIYAAKKHLKEIGELNEEMESEDDDFLNLKDDGSADEFNELGAMTSKHQKSLEEKAKSPIVFDNKQEELTVEHDREAVHSSRQRQLTPPPLASAAIKTAHNSDGGDHRSNITREPSRPSRERERRDTLPESVRKRPVHERLGLKPRPREPPREPLREPLREPMREPPRERRIRQEKEIYVPTFRRKEFENDRDTERELRRRENDRDRGRPREREREREHERERERERERDNVNKGRGDPDERRRRSTPDKPTSSVMPSAEERNFVQTSARDRKRAHSAGDDGPPRQRIGSRVIVAPPKTTQPSDDEDIKEKPVNSVIKIKPRTPMSPSKQACKNLLLRAMADAQRSTILAKSKTKKEPTSTRLKVSARLGERETKLSIRDRLKRGVVSSSAASTSTVFRRTTQNLVIEVGSDGLKRSTLRSRQEQVVKEEEEEYTSESSSSDSDESALNYMYSSQSMSNESDDEHHFDERNYEKHLKSDDVDYRDEPDEVADEGHLPKTQFVVTLNDEKAPAKYKTSSRTNSRTRAKARSRSVSPMPQVSSSSAGRNRAEASSTTSMISTSKAKQLRSRSHDSRKVDIKSRVSLKNSSSSSPSTALRVRERHSSNSSPTSNTPPPPRRSELIEIYRKPKDIKKIIIKNDSEDDELSPKKSSSHDHQRTRQRHSAGEGSNDRSTTPPLPLTKKHSASSNSEKRGYSTPPPRISPQKLKRTPIKFDLEKEINRDDGVQGNDTHVVGKRRSRSFDRERNSTTERHGGEDRRKISIRNLEVKKYDNIPSLSSVTLESSAVRAIKPKERCKYHPNCIKQFCDYYHPTAPCKSFPNCKYADKCMYSHPKCKYDIACTSIDCNFSHGASRNPSLLQPAAPPLSSHVVPVQNYKMISAAPAASSAMCKYYPNCTKVGCTFYHPKLCRFGKNCINKLECNFYHHEVQSSSKFKWVASVM